MSTWARISEDESQHPGESYRLVTLVNLPYPGSFGTIKALTEAQLALTAKPIEISRWETSKPIPMKDGSSPYRITMYYTIKPAPALVEAGIDPRVILGVILLVVGSLFALALLDKHFERLIHVAGEEARKTLGGGPESVFNPATLAFACLAIFLLTRSKG